MLNRILLFIGLVLLILALIGLVLISTRSFPKRTFASGVSGQDLVLPTSTSAPTSTFTPTGTSSPTNTSTTTATPTPKSDAVVNVKALNLRSGPGTVYDVVGWLKRGDYLEVTGKNHAEDWLEVIAPSGKKGWVAATYLRINAPLTNVPVIQVPPTPTPALLPPPIPLEPENGAAFLGEPATLKWQWDRARAPDEIFSVRVRREGETKLCHHDKADKPEYKGSLSYCTAGTHYWSVALVRDLRPWLPEDDVNRWQDLSEASEERWFYYVPGEEPWTWPTPPSGDDDGNGNGDVCDEPPCDGDGLPGPTPIPPSPPTPMPTPTSTSTPTPSPTATPTSTPTSTSTATLVPSTYTPTPTATLMPPTSSPTLQPTPSLTPTPLPTVMIEAEWPERMEIDRSDSIRISFIRTTEQIFMPTIEIAGHTVIADTPIPFGTPGAPIEKPPGSEYKASAIANLAGTAFKISPCTNEYQSLEQSQITWEWNIMPEKPYSQTINASIQVQWEPIGGNGKTIQRQIWRRRLDIFVEKPLITADQLSVTSLFSGFVGSALSIPWLYGRIKERREKRQKDEEGKPKILLP